MTSILSGQTPSSIKNRFSKGGNLSSASQGLQFSAQSQQWNNKTLTSTPQSGRNVSGNNSYDNSYNNTLLSASMSAGQENSTFANSNNQRYFADAHQRDRMNYPNQYGNEHLFATFGNTSSNQGASNIRNQMQTPADDQQRVFNIVLKNQSNQTANFASANNQQGRYQDRLNGQSITDQINNSYLASKSISNPANNILNRGYNKTDVIDKKRQDSNESIMLQHKQSELYRDQRMLTSLKEQGFLQNQQNDILLKDGQNFIRSRHTLVNILITVLVIFIAYLIYRLNCLFLNSRFSLFSEFKYVTVLSLSIITKTLAFKHKFKLNSRFFIETILGFCIDSLAIQYCVNEAITYFFVSKLNMDIRFSFKEYYLMSLSIICSLFFYVNSRFIENNQIQNVNKQLKTIVWHSFTETFSNFILLLKVSTLPILIAYIGTFLNGEKLSQLFFSKITSSSSTLTKCLVMIYLLTLTQILLFKICSELIINLKSQYIWNFLSENHDVHFIQHFYFVIADKKLKDDFLELKTLKFWQANFNNKQRVNILKTINIEGEQIQIWNILLRHGLYLKERFSMFKMNHITSFDDVHQILQKCPEQPIQRVIFILKNFKLILAQKAAYYELMYLLDMVNYSIQNLTNCMLAYSHIREYKELFSSIYSAQSIADYMTSVLKDLIELKSLFESDQSLSQIEKQLLSNIQTLMEVTNDQRLFNATIRSILNNPDSFYY